MVVSIVVRAPGGRGGDRAGGLRIDRHSAPGECELRCQSRMRESGGWSAEAMASKIKAGSQGPVGRPTYGRTAAVPASSGWLVCRWTVTFRRAMGTGVLAWAAV